MRDGIIDCRPSVDGHDPTHEVCVREVLQCSVVLLHENRGLV
jgi:hypothetical protein